MPIDLLNAAQYFLMWLLGLITWFILMLVIAYLVKNDLRKK